MTASLLFDARRAVVGAMRGAEHFSCVAGSAVWGTGGSSDIDLVVILPDTVGLETARRLRESFTRRYVDLHARQSRRPDADWPGEVLYQRDLESTLEGACLAAVGDTETIGLGPESESYRFWLSMVATGVPLTGPEAFATAADRCAALIAGLASGGWSEVFSSLGLEESALTRCARLRRALECPSSDVLPVLPAGIRPVPVLDREADRWRQVARDQASSG